MHVLDIRKIQRAGLLVPGRSFGWQWSRGGEKIASINLRTDFDAPVTNVTLDYRTRPHGGEWKDMNYPVYVSWTGCNYGGQRVWWLCPARGCGRRVAVLYWGQRVCVQALPQAGVQHAAGAGARPGWQSGGHDPQTVGLGGRDSQWQ